MHPTMSFGSVQAAILDVLGGAAGGTLTEAEIAARLRRLGIDDHALERALVGLEREGRVVVLVRALHDRHYPHAEIRIVSAIVERSGEAITAATAAAEARWQEFLREFLSTHRCC